MSVSRKIKAAQPGKATAEVTRFKELWKKHFTEEQRAEFLGWFADSGVSIAEIRQRVKLRHNLDLRHDSQISGKGSLREWCEQERANEVERDWASEEEAELVRLGFSGEKLRRELLDRMQRRAITRGDWNLGLAAIKQDISAEALQFDQEKFKEALRTKLETGLAELATHIKGNPKAQAAYEAFKASVKESTK